MEGEEMTKNLYALEASSTRRAEKKYLPWYLPGFEDTALVILYQLASSTVQPATNSFGLLPCILCALLSGSGDAGGVVSAASTRLVDGLDSSASMRRA